MEYVVDMQGFMQPKDDYVLKELAILPLQGDEPLVFLFKEPFPWKRLTEEYKTINTWLEHNYHGLSWFEGDRPYTAVGGILREVMYNATKVYVIGSIRKSWLERFKFNVYDITDIGYPPSNKIKLVTVCPHHNAAYKVTCAMHNVKRMRRFIVENSELAINAIT